MARAIYRPNDLQAGQARLNVANCRQNYMLGADLRSVLPDPMGYTLRQ
jgi:hypothetical protein